MDVDHKRQPHKMNVLGACKKVFKPKNKKKIGWHCTWKITIHDAGIFTLWISSMAGFKILNKGCYN